MNRKKANPFVCYPWTTFKVTYWNQDPRINDCWGNRQTWTGKARTVEESVRKAKKANTTPWFRVDEALQQPQPKS